MEVSKVIAYTGTTRGMTTKQRITVDELLAALRPTLAIHGAAPGGDDEFDKLCVRHKIPRRAYPSNLPNTIPLEKFRLRGGIFTNEEPRPPLARNCTMVDICATLIATPYTVHEVLRSGTWATIRYARKRKADLIHVDPNGVIVL